MTGPFREIYGSAKKTFSDAQTLQAGFYDEPAQTGTLRFSNPTIDGNAAGKGLFDSNCPEPVFLRVEMYEKF